MLSLLLVMFSPYSSFGQHNTLTAGKNILSGNLMGSSSVLGANYQRIIRNAVGIEFGIGLIGLGTGLTIYPKKLERSKFSFYTGIRLTSLVLVDVGGGTLGYIPFGFTLISEDRFVLGFDIGPARAKWITSSFVGNTSETSYFYCGFGNLKIGYSF